MKKYIVWFIISLLFPYFAYAYDLSVKDNSIVESATAKIEKIIATRGESLRNQVITLLKKATVAYNSNARMKAIIEKTIENIQAKDLSLGNLFGEENVAIVQPQPPYQKHEETRENRNIVTVPTIRSENKTPVCTTVYDTVTGASGTQTQVPRQSCTTSTTITSTPEPKNNLFGDVRTSTNITPQPVNISPTIKSCYIQNGEGQEMNGSCVVKSCNSGYSTSGNNCIQNQPTCQSDQHIENNTCVSNTKSCVIVGGLGQQKWGDTWSVCEVVSCNYGYKKENNSCVYFKSYISGYKDNTGNNFVNTLNAKNTNFIPDNSRNSIAKKSNGLSIEMSIVSPENESLLCHATIKHYSNYPGDFTEQRELGGCSGVLSKNINISNDRKTMIFISIKPGTLSNMSQLYNSFGGTSDSMSFSYDITD